jgi:geranylgeranyl pyrophosphate synthase
VADLERIHRAKTGALISAAATLGGRAASASAERIEALTQYGSAVGLAFQIADDVLGRDGHNGPTWKDRGPGPCPT